MQWCTSSTDDGLGRQKETQDSHLKHGVHVNVPPIVNSRKLRQGQGIHGGGNSTKTRGSKRPVSDQRVGYLLLTVYLTLLLMNL